MRNKILLGSIGALFLGALWWFSNYSFIEVQTVSTASQTEVVYDLANQSSNKTKTTKTNNQSFKKLVAKGNYEVSVTQGDKYGFIVVKAGGFLGTTKKEVKLEKERSRQFVGNSPSGCMYYSGSLLLSYECSGHPGANVHLPADQTRSTTVVKVPFLTEGQVEGITETKEGIVALVNQNISSEDIPATQEAYLLRGDFTIAKQVSLNSLSPKKPYAISSYKDGFLVYDQSMALAYYYSSVSAQPQNIALKTPDPKLKPFALSARADNLAVAYSNNTSGQVADMDSQGVSKAVQSVISTNKSSLASQLKLTGEVTAIKLCGSSKLCVLSNKKLSVYDVSGSKPKYLYSVTNVDWIETTNKNLLLSRNKEILGLDVDNGSGYRGYSYGDYKLCGIHGGANGYSLCLINNRQSKVTLYLNQEKTDSDSIDKKIYKLQQSSDIKSVSAYGRFIYISPNPGPMEYDSAAGEFDYNPAKVAAAKTRIMQKAKELGIGNDYNIVITL